MGSVLGLGRVGFGSNTLARVMTRSRAVEKGGRPIHFAASEPTTQLGRALAAQRKALAFTGKND